MINVDLGRRGLLIIVVMILFVTCLHAETIGIDFEDVNDLYYVDGYKSKNGTITIVADPRLGSAGSYAADFTWYADGDNQNQKGYMVKDLASNYDFTDANLSFWYKKIERSTYVGIELIDGGQIVEAWTWTPALTSWTQLSATDGDASGAVSHWLSGNGDIRSIDQIRFLHMNGGIPGSGTDHSVYYDDFEATGVVLKCRSNIPGDLNGDCYVDLKDFAKFAESWLLCSEPVDLSCTE